MNFLPSVFLSPAPDELFVSAALACEAYGRRRVLTCDSALRLGVLRGEAQREQAPYMKDQHRYLAALAHLLEYDFMATAGAGFPFGASKDVSTGAQPSLVAEFFSMIFVVNLDKLGCGLTFRGFKDKVEGAGRTVGAETVVFHEAILRAMHRV